MGVNTVVGRAKVEGGKNKKGQQLGTKGDRSRQRIIDGVSELLKTRNVWEVSVIDICNTCEIAPSNLYTYFKGVEEVLLALSHEVVEKRPPLEHLAQGSWRGRAGLMRARRFVNEVFDYWDAYRPVLKVIELYGDLDNEAFSQLRASRLMPIYEALQPIVLEAQKEGRLSEKMDEGVVVISAYGLIEAAAMHVPQIVNAGYKYNNLRETHARILMQHLTGVSS